MSEEAEPAAVPVQTAAATAPLSMPQMPQSMKYLPALPAPHSLLPLE